MVCPRCIETVGQVARSSGLDPFEIELGRVHLKDIPTDAQLADFREQLGAHGFEILESRKVQEVNEIKTLIIERVHYGRGNPDLKLSAYLAQSLGSDYSRISKLFSSVVGSTIEQYATRKRIERVKELLIYDQLTIAEIADQLDYSSAAHLSAQFKKETGLSPSSFKEMKNPVRTSLDSV